MDAAAVVLDKNSAKPTCRVGITCAENIVTYLDDPMLVSNATGAPNAAPGADRLQLETALAVFGINDTLPSSYVELSRHRRRHRADRRHALPVQRHHGRACPPHYQQSGDFITNGMSVKAIEHLDVGNNNGDLTAKNGGDTPMASICVSPGEAYVKGYDFSTLLRSTRPCRRPSTITACLTFPSRAHMVIVIVKEFVGSFDAVDGTRINLYDTAQQRITNNTYVGGGAAGSIIGTARVRDVYLASGSYGDKNATYYVYLYDIRMSTSALRNARSIGSSTGYEISSWRRMVLRPYTTRSSIPPYFRSPRRVCDPFGIRTTRLTTTTCLLRRFPSLSPRAVHSPSRRAPPTRRSRIPWEP